MAYDNLCFNCFCEKPINDRPCPKCGHSFNLSSLPKNCLMPGTLLNNRYVVGNPIGVGGFGITYKCLDLQIGGVCAVKEYLPANISGRNRPEHNIFVQDGYIERFNQMMKSFANEASLLQTLHHKNVITSYDSFFENNTAYYVMEYCDGIDLRRYTKNFTKKLDANEGLSILTQVMNGLEYVHSKGILHRDIKPDNIYITSNQTVKILDFGSARNEMEQYKKELSAIITVGYAPIEQYGGRGVQGHYTDIYALGATFYHLFTGRMPIESTQRVSEDKLVPFSVLRPDLPDNLKFCIERCMVLSKNSRVQNVGEMKHILETVNPNPQPAHVPPQPVPQPAPNPVPVPTPVSYRKRITGIASLTSRIYANLIDSGICGFVYLIFLIPTLVFFWPAAFVLAILYPAFSYLVNSLLELCMGRTLGKMMLNQMVLDRSGEKADAGQIFYRNLIKMLGVFVLLFAEGDRLMEDKYTNTAVYIIK